MNSIALFIKKKRKELRLTQVELADKAGIGIRFVRDVEQGKESLRTDKLNQLLLLFGHELSPVPISKNDEV